MTTQTVPNTKTNQKQTREQTLTCKRCHDRVSESQSVRMEYLGKLHVICHYCAAQMERGGQN